MTIEAGLAISRFVHYAALAVLFGVSLFPLYGLKTAELASAFRARSRTLLVLSAAFALASGASWAAFTAASMQDDIAGATDPDTLSAMVTETTFGSIWLARLGLLSLLAIVLTASSNRSRALRLFETALAAVALAAIALTGHTQMQQGAAQSAHVVSDALHLLAAGAWIGGIAGLLILLFATRDEESEHAAAQALQRFSPVGYLAVATLVASGVVNGLFMLNTFSALIDTQYGRLLLLKLGLFGVMLALAAGNRFVLTPRLDADTTRTPALRAFTRQVTIEQLVGLGVLAIVAVLGTTEPPM